MVHKTLSTLVWRSHGSPLSIPLKEKSHQTKSCFKGKNTRICKFKSTNRFFQHAFDINSGIPSTQQRVRESDDLKLNPLNQERNNKEQVINHNKDNTNTNKINGKFEIVLIIISKTVIIVQWKTLIIWKKLSITISIWKVINKQKQNAEKDVRTEENSTRNISINCKNATLEKILENEKINFRRNLENALKCLRKKNMHKIVVGANKY